MLLTSWLTAVKGRFGRRMRRRVRKTTPENRPAHRVGQYAELLEDRTLLSARLWESVGPTTIENGLVDGISDEKSVIGAIHTVAAHPEDSGTLFIGGTNGGIWKTGSANEGTIDWTAVADDAPSLSIGALEFDPTDDSHNTLVAGIGQF
ncbi:MAG: hypothetical protein QF363_10200, partial [Planctomycetaceae bacterium]|nr:hypothetical protein [Planctomycetaceae bacterium]